MRTEVVLRLIYVRAQTDTSPEIYVKALKRIQDMEQGRVGKTGKEEDTHVPTKTSEDGDGAQESMPRADLLKAFRLEQGKVLHLEASIETLRREVKLAHDYSDGLEKELESVTLLLQGVLFASPTCSASACSIERRSSQPLSTTLQENTCMPA